MDDYFGWPYIGTWILAFLATWAYCVAQYGFLLGFGLGWLPAAILATLIALLWPLVWLAAIALALWILWALKQAG